MRRELTRGRHGRCRRSEPGVSRACSQEMRHRLAPLVTVLGVLAAPAPAPAKELSKVSVCGASGECTTYDTSDFNNLMFLAEDAGPTNPPASAAAWYRVRFTVDEREHGGGYDRWTAAYVPSADRLRIRDDGGNFTWVGVHPRAARVLRQAARNLPPLPAAQLSGLPIEPPQARVDEVVTPPAETATSRRSDPGTTPLGWILAGAFAAAVVLGTVIRTVRRPSARTSRRAKPSYDPSIRSPGAA
jgi:hypothetical protein